MRLFYDDRSSRNRAEALIFLADILAVSAAILFATGSVHAGSRPGDVLLLALWASIPRAVSLTLGRLQSLSDGASIYLGTVLFGALSAVLLLAGWELIVSAAPRQSPPEITTTAAVFLAWGADFLLFRPRAYRLRDFLLWAVVLFGLKDGKPLPYLWLSVVFLGFYVSSAARHLLFDSFAGVRRPRINLRNARVVAFIAAGGSLALFAGVHFAAAKALGEKTSRTGSAPAADGGRLAGAFVEGEEGGAAAGSLSMEAAREAASQASRKRLRLGFTYKVGLRDLSLALFDRRIVFRVRARVEGAASADWRPAPGMLWKAVSFAEYDSRQEAWAADVDSVERPWPTGGSLERSVPSTAAASPFLLEHEVVHPLVRNFVAPYFTRRIVSSELTHFREAPAGDVFPVPPPSRGTRYVTLTTAEAEVSLPAGASGGHEEQRYSVLPPPRDAGIDLRRHAERLFRGTADTRAKVERLREHFARGFRYSAQALWRLGKQPLAAFLEKERVGNCTYFATAGALLLRAGGVSTRLVVGFKGGEWDDERREAVIRNGAAHAWIEVFFPPHGWIPADPTAWAPLDPAYRPPPEALPAIEAARRDAESRDLLFGQELEPIRADLPDGGGAESGLEAPRASAGPEVVRQAPAGAIEDLLEEPVEDEDGGWIQYAGTLSARELEEAGLDGAGFDPTTVPRLQSLDLGRGSPDESPRPRPDSSTLAAEPPGWERSRPYLRPLLLALGLTALSLALLAFLRPRRRQGEREGEEGESPGEIHLILETTAADLACLDESLPRDRVLAEYMRLQSTLERTRSHRKPHQTPREHGRAIARGNAPAASAFEQLHAVLYAALYGAEEVTEEDATVVQKCCGRLRRLLG